jgi:methionyl-tRNA formyltransferase
LGTINLHASLLPQYRGAAPINWALINGEMMTGVTTFLIDRQIDTGKIILQEEEPIQPLDDAGTLHDRLMNKGAGLILKTVELIREGKVIPADQKDSGELKPAPKLTREMCEINLAATAAEIHNFVRGLSPHPGAWTVINSRKYQVYKTNVEAANNKRTPGLIESDGHNFLRIHTGSGLINILEIQPEGRKKMLIRDFLRGNKI